MNELVKTDEQLNADERAFALGQRKAKLMASSDLVPKQYQGSVADCYIALQMAERMDTDPLTVVQNLHIIQGKPSWSSAYLIGCFNTSGKFSAIRYEFSGKKATLGRTCTAVATELATGERLEGPAVSLQMAKDEGWSTKAGSKWRHMSELMLRYRAAAFLIRTVAPEIALGMGTAEEAIDIAQDTDSEPTRQPAASKVVSEVVTTHKGQHFDDDGMPSDEAGLAAWEKFCKDELRRCATIEELEDMGNRLVNDAATDEQRDRAVEVMNLALRPLVDENEVPYEAVPDGEMA